MDIPRDYYETKAQQFARADAWIFNSPTVEPENILDSNDPIHTAPTLVAPRQVFSPIGDREYATTFYPATTTDYSDGLTESCKHVLDDPFESEEEAEAGRMPSIKPPRRCRKCYIESMTDNVPIATSINIGGRQVTAYIPARSNQHVVNLNQDTQSPFHQLDDKDEPNELQTLLPAPILRSSSYWDNYESAPEPATGTEIPRTGRRSVSAPGKEKFTRVSNNPSQTIEPKRARKNSKTETGMREEQDAPDGKTEIGIQKEEDLETPASEAVVEIPQMEQLTLQTATQKRSPESNKKG